MSSLACSLALLVASGLGGIGTAHPMEVTVQDDALFLHQQPAAVFIIFAVCYWLGMICWLNVDVTKPVEGEA